MGRDVHRGDGRGRALGARTEGGAGAAAARAGTPGSTVARPVRRASPTSGLATPGVLLRLLEAPAHLAVRRLGSDTEPLLLLHVEERPALLARELGHCRLRLHRVL